MSQGSHDDARPGDITPTPLQEGLRGQTFLRVVAKMLFPFILVFGVYVITHGELGPGGGFQGGVILGASFILMALARDLGSALDQFPERRYFAIAHGAVRASTIESSLVPDRGDGKRGSWRGRIRSCSG